MAYKRIDPTFNKDPEVKKTVIQNPDGTTTYRDTWSSKIPARSTSFKAPSSAKTSYVAKRSTPAQTTSGSRETTTVRPLKSVGMKTEDIKAPLPEAVKIPVTKKELVKTTETYREKEWLKNNPGKTTENRNKDIQKRKAQLEKEYNKESKGFKGMFSSKKAVNPCKTC